MTPVTYTIRWIVYYQRNFGGTSDWAVDLNFEFEGGGTGDRIHPDDVGIDEEWSCDYGLTFRDLDDLNNNAAGLSWFCRQVYALEVLENMLEKLYADHLNTDNGYDSKFNAYVRYINRITPYAIDDYMSNKGGLKCKS